MTAPTVATAASLAALDAAYRAAIARTSLTIIQILVGTWQATVDPENFAGTVTPWLDSSTDAILAGQRQSVQYANLYTDAVRNLQAPRAPLWTPPPPDPPTAEQVRRSVAFTGFYQPNQQLQRLERGLQTADPAERPDLERDIAASRSRILQQALAGAAGTATRFVTEAGADQLVDNVVSDGVAIGWVRVTKPRCCHFCAMLASRGMVYKEESFVRSNSKFKDADPGTINEQKVHDNCGCGLRPVYTRFDDLPDRTEDYSDLWMDSTRGLSGADARNAFRKAYEASELSRAS